MNLDHLTRTKSTSSNQGTNGDAIKASSAPDSIPKELENKGKPQNDVPPSPTRSRSVTGPPAADSPSKPQSPLPKQPPATKKPVASDKGNDSKDHHPSKPIPINAPKNSSSPAGNKSSMSRRNSWISSISSKFSSGSTPPSRSHARDAQNSQDQTPSPSVDTSSNPFGAAVSPGKDEKKERG